MKEDGLIIWDDYDPHRYSVKKCVDKILQKYPQYNTALVEFRGHLFTDNRVEKDAGIMLMTTQDL